MITPNTLARSLEDSDLCEMVLEALDWRCKGTLCGDALRNFALRLELESGISTDDTLQIADSLVVAEAAGRFARQHSNATPEQPLKQ